MRLVRQTLSWLSLYLVGTCFFLSANIFVLSSVLSSDNVKKTLRQEDTYSKLVPAILSTATYNGVESAGQLPVNEPWVQQAAVKAFPASDLEQKGNSLIDSTFAWLDGTTASPEFRLDFTADKQHLGSEIGSYTQNRLASLPRCSANNIPASIDAYKIDCLPYGVNPVTVAAMIQQQISNDQNFLKNPVISSDSLNSGQIGSATGGKNPFDQLDGTRSFYQHRSLLLWLLPLATVFFAVSGYLLAVNRDRALRRLSRSFASSAVGLLFLALLLLGAGFTKLLGVVANDQISKDILSPILLHFAAQAKTIYIIFAVVGLALALGLFILHKRLASLKAGGETGIRTLGTR